MKQDTPQQRQPLFDGNTKFGDRFLLKNGDFAVFCEYYKKARCSYGAFIIFDKKWGGATSSLQNIDANGHSWGNSPDWDIDCQVDNF